MATPITEKQLSYLKHIIKYYSDHNYIFDETLSWVNNPDKLTIWEANAILEELVPEYNKFKAIMKEVYKKRLSGSPKQRFLYSDN